VVKPLPRLKLQGFNNLTKALSFNIYDVCYAVSEDSASATSSTSTRPTTPTG
jgi:S-adenosylmethionine/arginine decarboxylase-like enzyme